MKRFILFSIAVLCFTFTKAQVTMTPSGTTDSATVKYITTASSISGTYGTLTIQANLIKNAAVGGAAVAGYAILEGSIDGTNFSAVPTWKYVTWSTYEHNMFGTDTLTLTNTTANQTKIWQVTSFAEDAHPYLFYRVKIVMTTSSVAGTGRYLLRRKP